MKVSKVRVKNFMGAAASDIDLPELGLVLVLGENGSGKSMLIEAIATAMWGETIRGSTPWQPKKAGEVEILCEYGTVTRKADSRNTKTLQWSGSPDVGLTCRKAQDVLDKVIPPFNTWRYTNVYTTELLDSFSHATDAERKRLLENIIRLDRFDDALKQAKDNLNAERTNLVKHESALINNGNDIRTREGLISQMASLRGPSGTMQDLEDMRAKAVGLKTELQAMKQRSLDAEDALQKWTTAQSNLNVRLSVARRNKDKLAEGKCPTCGSEVQHDTTSVVCEIKDLEQKLQQMGPKPEVAEKAAIARIEAELLRLTQEGRSLRESLERDATLEEKLSKIREEIEKARDCTAELKQKVDISRHNIALEEACVSALSIRGLRASLLGGALEALSNGANYWLSLFYPSSTVTVSIALDGDKVVFAVSGLAQDTGYKSLSNGQKRRINLAVVMALGTMAGYARGTAGGGTIFFDEVLDTLDEEGQDVAASVLQELAKTNCVFVISHSREFCKKLGPDLTYRVKDGKYRQIDKTA